jgi:AraC-like DNA-binding protein
MRDRPDANEDPLHEVLELLRVEGAISSALETGGAWSLQFPPYEHVKFAAVLRGGGWLTVDRVGEPVWVEAGDAYLLADGAPYRLASDPSLPPVEALPYFLAADDGIARYGGDENLIVGGGFRFDELNAELLLDALPPLVVMRGDDPAAPRAAAVVRAAVELLAAERDEPALGSSLMAERLADVLFLQALRVVVAAGGSPQRAGWLSALGDPQIGAALRLMHGDVTRRWTLAELASEVGMSRSSFADRFRRLVGSAPLDYLLRWRMRTAARALEDPARTVSSIAFAWGYGSDSAFSSAFKRVMGSAPAHYRRTSREPAALR